MEFPPKPKTSYVFDNSKDKRMFKKLGVLSELLLTKNQQEVLILLYSQLERDWRTPLERYINKLLKKMVTYARVAERYTRLA